MTTKNVTVRYRHAATRNSSSPRDRSAPRDASSSRSATTPMTFDWIVK